MIKHIFITFCVLSTCTFAKSDDHDRLAYEYLGQNCCFSTNKTVECCPLNSKCDPQYGCLQIENRHILKDNSNDCPPLSTNCSFLVGNCCPYVEAECCSDKVHCCPHGYECDLDHNQCNQKSTARITSEKNIPSKDNLIQCGNNVWCPQTDECCMDQNGEHSCCRNFRQSLNSENIETEIIVHESKVKDCPPFWTKCFSSFLFDRCCPYVEAECCSDKAHCCPHGYECDLDHNKCYQKSTAIITNEKDMPSKDNLIQCGNNVWCPRTDECCMGQNGEHSCCRNFSQSLKIDNIETEIIVPQSEVKVCPPDWTKCFSRSLFDLCCPFSDAKCCSDNVHCCPHGYECDLNHNRCNQKNNTRNTNEKDIPSKDNLIQCGNNVLCPRTDECCTDENGEHSCCRNFRQSLKINNIENESIVPQSKVKDCPPDWTKCTPSYLWDTCCHYVDAECCSDKVHCCPHGYECDLNHNRCNQKNNSRITNEKSIPSRDNLIQCGNNVLCPRTDECCTDENGEHSCCRNFSQSLNIENIETEIIVHESKIKDCPPFWTKCFSSFLFDLCCPYVEAECCSDKAHCCPRGYECDLDHSQCNQKITARITNEKDIPSKDNLMQCGNNVWCSRPDECCIDENGEYSCCRNFSQSLKFENTENEIIVSQPKVKDCPPLWTTCFSGFFFDICCPLPQAKCCVDKFHCCPAGTKCCTDLLHCCPNGEECCNGDDPCCSFGYECDFSNKKCVQKNSCNIVLEDDNISKDDRRKCDNNVWCSRTDECCQDENEDFICCQTSQNENTETENKLSKYP